MDVVKLHCQVCCLSFGTISALKLHLHSHVEKLKEIFPKDACRSQGSIPIIQIVNVTRDGIFKKPHLSHIHGISQLTMCFSPGSNTSFYLCHICKDKCSSHGISHHLKTGDHYRNIFSNTDPNLMDFAWIPSNDITVLQQHKTNKETELPMLQIPLKLLLKLEDKYYSEVMEIFKENEKLLKLLEAAFIKPTRIEMYQKDRNRKHPLLGMQHLVECICEEIDDKRHYLCTLCQLSLNTENIIKHVLSFDHIFCYISKWHPTSLLSKVSYKYDNQFRSMILNLSKQAEEISGGTDVMKKVSLKPAEFTSVNFKDYKQALQKLGSIKKCSFETNIKPARKLVTNSAPSLAQSAPLSSPEQSVSPPEQQSATLSGKSASSPTQSTSSPAQSTLLSGKLASSPEQPVSSPAQSASLLAQSATSSVKSASSPAQSASLSGKLAPPVAESGPSTRKSQPSVALPVVSASSLAQASLSSGKVLSSLSHTVSSSGKSTPMPSRSAPSLEQSAVSQAQSAPSSGQLGPCLMSAPLPTQCASSLGQSASLNVQPLSSSEDYATLQAQPASSPAQSAPSSVKSASSPVQFVASSVVSPSSSTQATPSTGNPASSSTQSAPLSEKSASSVAKSGPYSSSPAQSVALSVVSSSSPTQATSSSGNPAFSSTQSVSSLGKSAPSKAESAPLSEKSAPYPGKSSSLPVPPKSWPVLCQNCNEFLPNMFRYLRHLSGEQHKRTLMERFEMEQFEMEQYEMGQRFKFGKRAAPYLHIYTYVRRCLMQEDAFIGMPFVVSCLNSMTSLPAFYTCFACKECFDGKSVNQHFASQKHLLMTLVQYQNSDLLPFAWETNDISSRKELRKRVMESEKPPSKIPIKVFDLPTWKFSQIKKLTYENVQMNLQDYRDIFANQVPLSKSFLQFRHNGRFPLLGLEFLVSYSTLPLKNQQGGSLLCLLCDRELSEEEHYFHVYSREHVSSFLKSFHPGSLNSSNVNAETLFDLAQQASELHPKGSMQVIELIQCMRLPCSFSRKKKILSYGMVYNNKNMVVPPISPKGKLLPSKTLQQKENIEKNNSPKTNSDTQKPCANALNASKNEAPSEEKSEVKPVKNNKDSRLLKGEEKTVIQKPPSCSLNSDRCLEEENQSEVSDSKEDVGKGIFKCVPNVNEKKRRNSTPENCQDGDECIKMDHKRQRLTVEQDILREEHPKIKNIEQNEEAADAADNPNVTLEKGLSTLFDCRCDKHEPIYICECCSLKIPQGNIISHITELGHPKVHQKVLFLGEDDYIKISIQNFETAVLTIKAFLDSREAHLKIPLVADPLSSATIIQVDTTVTLDDQHDSDDTLKDSKLKYADLSKDGHSLAVTATSSEMTRGFSIPKDDDLTSKDTKAEMCHNVPMEICDTFTPSVTEDKTISSKVTAASSKLTTVTSTTSGDVFSTTNLVTASAPLKGKAAAKSEKNHTTNIAGLKTQIPKNYPKYSQTSTKTSVTNKSKDDFFSPADVHKGTEICRDKRRPACPNANTETHAHKNQIPDVSRLAATTSFGSEPKQPLTEPSCRVWKNLESIKFLPRIGRNQMIKVVCPTKSKRQVYCKLCSVRLLYSQHLSSIEHHYNYLQMMFPRLSIEPKEIEEKLNALAKEEKQQGYADESINVTWEQYGRLASLKASKAIDEIKNLLQSRDMRNCAKGLANPAKVSQEFSQGSPCEVSSSDCRVDVENPHSAAQPEEVVSPSQFSKTPETFQEAHVSSQQQPQQMPDPKSQNALKISESKWTSLTEVVEANPQTSFTVTNDMLQNQQRPIQEDTCGAEHDPTLEFFGKGQQIDESSNLASYLKVKNLDSKPIVGKDKVWECREVSRRTFYLCESCEMMIPVNDICQHFISLVHQFNYVRKNHSELLEFWSEEDLSMDEKLEIFDYVVHELSNRDRALEVDVKVVLLRLEFYEYLQNSTFCEAVKALQSISKQKQRAPWELLCPLQQKIQHTEAVQGLEETLTSQVLSAPIPETDEKSGNDESRFGSEGVTSDRHVSPKESCHSLSEDPGVSALVFKQSEDLMSTSQVKENNMNPVYTKTKEAHCFPGKCSLSRKRPPDASLETLARSSPISPNDDPLPKKWKPNPGQAQPPSESPTELVNPTSDQQVHLNYFAVLSNYIIKMRNQKLQLSLSASNNTKAVDSGSTNSRETMKSIELCPGTSNINVKGDEAKQKNCLVQSTATKPTTPVSVEVTTPKEVLSHFESKNQVLTPCGKSVSFANASLDNKTLLADIKSKTAIAPPTSASINPSDLQQLVHVVQENMSKPESGCVNQDPEKETKPDETSVCPINTIVTQRAANAYHSFSSPQSQALPVNEVPQIAVTTPTTETSVTLTTYAQYSQAVYGTSGLSVCIPPVNPLINPPVNPPFNSTVHPLVMPPFNPPPNSPIYPNAYPSFNPAVNSGGLNQSAVCDYSPAVVNYMQSFAQNPAISMQQQQAYQQNQQYQQWQQEQYRLYQQYQMHQYPFQ
ncbi:uncharacterized protein LOC114472109 isoform X2 [Gouania willdenowi]|uniref:uncharacterized protein LOC114472109 isoform X2 n=1 Tax=Gouania willdenowi TaxID=441366 RepID=UPI001054A438|nr:uncharacterized protein LOC114472109 isoform X2 [Gouania willdenowi]